MDTWEIAETRSPFLLPIATGAESLLKSEGEYPVYGLN